MRRGGVKESSSNTTEQERCQPSTINQSCNKVYGISSFDSNAMKSSNPHSGIYEADTSRTLDNNGGNPACNQGGIVCLQRRFSTVNVSENGISPTLEAGAGEGGNNMPIVIEGNGSRPSHKGDGYKESDVSYTLNSTEQHAVCVGNGQLAQARISDKVGALNCMHDQQAIITYGLDRASFNQGENAQYDFSVEEDLAQTIVAKGPGGVMTQSVHCAQETTKEWEVSMSMKEKSLSNKIQIVYDWHRQDTRMTECKDVCVTCAAGWGGRWK